jgi:hypothetical protein
MYDPDKTAGFLPCLHFTQATMPSNYTLESLFLLYDFMSCKYFYGLIYTILRSLKSL